MRTDIIIFDDLGGAYCGALGFSAEAYECREDLDENGFYENCEGFLVLQTYYDMPQLHIM